jgi:CBS domain-containing membrane protein
MKREYFISEIMTRNLITLNINDQLGDAKKIFEEKLIRQIPMVSEKAIIGMLSYVDFLKVSFPDVTLDEKNIETYVYDMFSIEQVMTKNLFMVPPNSTIKEVGMLLAEKAFHALPVVEDDELVGIVTTTDLIKFLVKHMD